MQIFRFMSIEKKLYRIRDLIEIERENSDITMHNRLKIYEEFIKNKGMDKQFEEFYRKEVKKYKYE